MNLEKITGSFTGLSVCCSLLAAVLTAVLSLLSLLPLPLSLPLAVHFPSHPLSCTRAVNRRVVGVLLGAGSYLTWLESQWEGYPLWCARLQLKLISLLTCYLTWPMPFGQNIMPQDAPSYPGQPRMKQPFHFDAKRRMVPSASFFEPMGREGFDELIFGAQRNHSNVPRLASISISMQDGFSCLPIPPRFHGHRETLQRAETINTRAGRTPISHSPNISSSQSLTIPSHRSGTSCDASRPPLANVSSLPLSMSQACRCQCFKLTAANVSRSPLHDTLHRLPLVFCPPHFILNASSR